MGPHSDYVVSGSDDGNIFIWDKKTAHIVQVMKGDVQVVNCIQSHPYDCVLASSGIEDNVKIWEPSLATQKSLEDLDKIIARNKEVNYLSIHYDCIGDSMASVCTTLTPSSKLATEVEEVFHCH
jgi:WD40 repeat protein